MSNYNISKYSFDKAKKLNVLIKPSILKEKKIDVFDKNNNYITSIGDMNYSDYPTYIKTKGLQFANKRKKLYKQRHNKDRNNINTRSYYADKILW